MWVSVKRGLTVLNSIRVCLKFFSYNFLNENLYFGDLNSALHNFYYAAQDPVPRKMVKFNPGLSQISSTVFSSKNMQLGVTKYC